MGHFWGPELIEQIRTANNIVDVINEFVPLRRAGSNYKALSPFKKEKTPSFMVNESKQIWHCFSSNQGGDVFKFIQLYENIDFPQAVRRLAERAGIPLPETGNPYSSSDSSSSSLKEQLLLLHEKVAWWWHRILMKDPLGKPARDYLKSREISAETAKEFLLGYAPEGWNTTLNWTRKEGFSENFLEQAGLIIRKDSTVGSFYDRFRGRLIFPIFSESAKVIAFSGRTLDPEAKEAKYVNSPETSIFIKGQVLFGLHLHKRDLIESRQAIVCEGPLDLITCHQAGLRNVVASQGTAFTEGQARILKRNVDEVVLCFDSDSAGQLAVIRSMPELTAVDLPARVLRLPDAPNGMKQDPDSFIRQHGVETFRKLVKEAPGFWHDFVETLSQTHDPSSERGRVAIKREAFELLSHLNDFAQLDRTLMMLAARLGIAFPLLKNEFLKNRKVSTYNKREGKEGPSTELMPCHPIITQLLQLCLHDPNLTPVAQRGINPAWIARLDGQGILTHLFESHAVDGWHDAASFITSLSSEDQNRVARLLAQSLPGGDPSVLIRDCLNKLQRAWLEVEIRQKEQAIREARDLTQSHGLLTELVDLRRKMGMLETLFNIPDKDFEKASNQ